MNENKTEKETYEDIFFKKKFNQHLDKNGKITINGCNFDPSDILYNLDKEAYQDGIYEWKDDYFSAQIEKANEILSEFEQIDDFEKLQEEYNDRNLIPFVGAGLSMPSGFPSWKEFIIKLSKSKENTKKQCEELIKQNKLQESLELISKEIGYNQIDMKTKKNFNKSINIENIKGSINYLPLAFPHNCIITTNLDNIIETLYENADKRISEIINGNNIFTAVASFNPEKKMLFKIHGNAYKSQGRVLFPNDYDDAYSSYLENLSSQLLFKHSLLFMGASLVKDQILTSMKEHVKKVHNDSIHMHYAFLEEIENQEAKEKITDQLSDAYINPIWYPKKEHDESIEAFLCKLYLKEVVE